MNEGSGLLFQDSNLNYCSFTDAHSLLDWTQRETLSLLLPVSREGSEGVIVPVLLTLTCTRWRERKRGEAVVAGL